MPAAHERRDIEQLARLGVEVFDRCVRPSLRPEHEGKFVALDVETGSNEIDDDDYEAVARLRARLPEAEIRLARAGHPAAYQIRRAVNARLEGVVRLRVRGPVGADTDVETVVDSGFTSSLTLPAPIVATLGLVRQAGGSAVLADGSVRPFDVYAAEVEWGGTWRPVLVSVVGAEAQLGMGLLAGHRLRMEVISGGVVDVSPLP